MRRIHMHRIVAGVFFCWSFCWMPLWLSAAGGNDASEPSVSRRNASGLPPAALDSASPSPVDDISGYTIRIAAWWNGPDTLSMVGRTSLQRWAEVEEKYDVRMEWVQVPNPQIALEKMITTAMIGEPFADVVYLEASSVIPALAEKNLVLPLDDYFDFSQPKWRETTEGYPQYRGKIYGITPFRLGGGSGLWYNKTFFKREGFPDPRELQEKGQWTWDEYLKIARAATRDTDGDGTVDQWGIAIGYELEYPIIWSNGAYIVDESDEAFTFALDSPAAIEALEFIKQIYESNVTTYGENVFIAGRAAMYGGELFQGRNMMLNMRDEYGFVFFPKGPKMDDHISIANAPLMQVFPANLNYPPDRLAEIIEDITLFELADDIRMEFLEGQLTSREDIRTVYEMMEKSGSSRKSSFPHLTRIVGEIFRDIRKGVSPVTAVEERKQVGQAAIDSVFE